MLMLMLLSLAGKCSNDNDNDFLTKWNESDKKIFTYEEMRWENNNEDEW